ncbi:MAG: Bax inhibitor-1/YccA family protein [Solobacterium sp.]|nr:Bax inhibitor-1/YccA family protein [Solobacterium sp.]
MSEMNRTTTYTALDTGLKAYILNVFTKMGLGLALTAAIAYFGYTSLASGGALGAMVFGNPIIMVILVVLQLGLCIWLSTSLHKLNPTTASILYFAYCAITGITFSTLPFVYGFGNVFTAFLFAAVMFGGCVVIGHTTNVDLSQFRGLLLGGLVALVITTILSIFIPILRESLLISYFGVILFLGLTAYDMQKIKHFYYSTNDPVLQENLATFGAFELYLDFINLFLQILRILGRRSRD